MEECKPKDIIAKIHEMEEMHKELRLMGKRIADHLGVDELTIEFDYLKDESSRLEMKPKPRILISDRVLTKYDYASYCLAHEYRHVFQIYWASLMDDDLAKLFREDMANTKNSDNIDVNNAKELLEYSIQTIEVDAEAFAIYYLRTFEDIHIKKEQECFERLIETYIRKYGDRL